MFAVAVFNFPYHATRNLLVALALACAVAVAMAVTVAVVAMVTPVIVAGCGACVSFVVMAAPVVAKLVGGLALVAALAWVSYPR